MWLFTQHGMVSVVQHREDPNMLLVRSREPGVLRELFKGTETRIHKLPKADYRYRALVDRDGFWDVMIRQINQINYPNFKNHLLNEKRVDMNTYRAYEEVYYAAAFLENGDEPGVFPVEIGQE